MAKIFRREEVKQHNDNENSWIVINNSVYDVTAFLNEHPGGEEVLLEQAGRDGSEAFEDVGHSSDAKELMTKYKIGEIIECECRPVKDKTNTWSPSDDSQPQGFSSLKSWIVPITIGILVTIIYRYYFQSH
ncbi:hypothetical protein RI129_000743 [Pyrocoelia pectoralis]|uniref:Cytochrome b5 n=1 Tax=Pyrocoelia pectoralis TaxID=417401 RepID=A0AAN7VVF3_9COLE